MARYSEYKQLNLPEIDSSILEFWKSNEVFKKSVEQRPALNPYIFYEGPPSANGKPGIHHVMARTIKDLFCRFHTMLGERVERKGGWDTHGLPVELAVENALGITKDDIGKTISIEDYNKRCRETVMRFKDLWDDLTIKMGYWVDLDQPYLTFNNNYIESVWWLLKQIYDKGLLYKGYSVQPYSPGAGTGLSSHELNMPGAYKDVTDTSVVAQFKVVKTEKSDFLFKNLDDNNLYIIAWTTTPWTLPSNVALAVGKRIEYVKVKTFNPYTFEPCYLILASDLVPKWFKKEQSEKNLEAYKEGDKIIPYKVLESFFGPQLEGIEYEQLMPYVQPDNGDAFKVLIGDFVSTEDGTGIVHIAPSFGSDDMMVGKKYGMGSLTLVDKQGKFVDEVTDFAGRFVKDYRDEKKEYKNVDIDIAIKLKTENKAFNVQRYSHNYPHCWRTDKPVLYYPLDSWFIKASSVRDKMTELNKTINWKPKHTGEKRFGNWLENLQDWNLSRSRFWGTPLPIWRSEDGKEELCIGSIEELKQQVEIAQKMLDLEQELPDDLHRPYIDQIILSSPTGKPMKREADLIDVWFDSGSMPFAQWHYPFENNGLVDGGKSYPADFISEGVDQTRGWFYTLHAISSMVKESVAFKNVVSTGLVLDKNGVKMSKRLGNVIDPFEALSVHGADANRWYMISNAPPWDNLKFDLAGVEEVKRKFFGTLYNTYSFFTLYANIDEFTFDEKYIPIAERPEIDRWIISLLHSLSKYTKERYSDYEPTAAARRIQNFVDEHLSNWYVRLCRRRFWKGEYTKDKISAYQTLYECLETISKLMAPIAPFFAEWLYKNLNDISQKESFESVHLSLYPIGNQAFIDKSLEERMEYAQRISSLVHSLRRKEKIRVRQPLQRVLLPILDASFQKQVEAVESLIRAEVNVKEVEYITDSSGVIKKNIKPNFKTLGRKLGRHMKAAATKIASFNQETIVKIEQSNMYSLVIDENTFELNLEDFIITSEDLPGWQVASDGRVTVALDIHIDENLRAEGIARELVNRIQNLRKQMDFNVTDRIKVTIEPKQELLASIELFSDYIQNEVLADSIRISEIEHGDSIELTQGVSTRIEVDRT